MEETSTIADIILDFKETLGFSQRVSLEDIKKYNLFMILTGRVIKLFAPLM